MLNVLDLINLSNMQVYTHYDEVEGQIDIAVGLLDAMCRRANIPTILIPVEPQYAKVVRKQRGLEPHRLNRLTIEICESNPLLFLDFSRTRTQLLADGNHRYYRLYYFGRRQARAWLLPEAAWRPFQIAGMPQQSEEECLNSFSGIR